MGRLGYIKHTIHVFTLCSLIVIFNLKLFVSQVDPIESKDHEKYGVILYSYLTVIQYLGFLYLPQMIFVFLGLILYNAFPGDVEVKKRVNLLGQMQAPHFCFRVVTRGLFPELVQRNVVQNYTTCTNAGLEDFSIEVVTEKELPLDKLGGKVRQLVVPASYKTPSRALFKARALQYALEPKVNVLKEGDYIVHLDEETLVTKNVINGIINFAMEGTHAFGQGLITYANQEIVNWVTTLADSFRVADDMGKIRFQFNTFHHPLFGWKGSFVVTKYEAEKDVTYDNGPDGSIAEDCYFAMIAFKKGYSFSFIEGEMWEKSPFTIHDLLRQRKRWIQGIWLVVHSPAIPISKKFFLGMSLYGWLTLPIATMSCIMSFIFPIPTSLRISSIGAFCSAVTIYMYIFGVLKSFDLKNTGFSMLFVYLVGAVFTLPLNVVIENVAVIWGLVGSKHNFYIVEKDVNRKVVLEV